MRVDVFHHIVTSGEDRATDKELLEAFMNVKEAIEKMRLTVERTEGRMASMIAFVQEYTAGVKAAVEEAADDATAVGAILALNDELESKGVQMAAALEAVPPRVLPGQQQPPREAVNEAGFPIGGSVPVSEPAPPPPVPEPAAQPPATEPPPPDPAVAPQPLVPPEPPAA